MRELNVMEMKVVNGGTGDGTTDVVPNAESETGKMANDAAYVYMTYIYDAGGVGSALGSWLYDQFN